MSKFYQKKKTSQVPVGKRQKRNLKLLLFDNPPQANLLGVKLQKTYIFVNMNNNNNYHKN